MTNHLTRDLFRTPKAPALTEQKKKENPCRKYIFTKSVQTGSLGVRSNNILGAFTRLPVAKINWIIEGLKVMPVLTVAWLG